MNTMNTMWEGVTYPPTLNLKEVGHTFKNIQEISDIKFLVKVMMCKFEILNKKVGSPLSKKRYTHRNMGYFQEFPVEN